MDDLPFVDTELVGDFECVLERGAISEYDEVVLDSEDERIGQCKTRQVKLVNEGSGAHGDALELGSGNLDSTSSGKRNQLTSYGNEHGSSDINYIGSPILSESSQDKALNFVESFLTYNNFGLSPVRHSTNMKKERSRLSLVKGIPDVAKRISLIRSTGDMETFKWVDTSCPKVDSAAMHFQSREYDAFPNESADNLDFVYLKKQRVGSVYSHAASLKYVSGDSRQNTKVPGDIVENGCNEDLDSNLDAETSGKEMQYVSVAGNEDEDLGFCTQMAAEVMESLSHGPCITTVFYEDPWHTRNRFPQEVKAHVAGYENLPWKKNVYPCPGERQLPAKRLVICALPFKRPKKQKLEIELALLNKAQNTNVSADKSSRRALSNPSHLSGRRATKVTKQTEGMGHVKSNHMEELDHHKGKFPSSSSSAITRRTRQFRSGTRLEERVKDPENYQGRWTRRSLKRPKQVLSSNDLFEGGSSIILNHVSNGSDESGIGRTKGVNREKQIEAALSTPLSRLDTWRYPERKRTKRLYARASHPGGNPANALAQNSTAGNDLPRSDYHKEPCQKSLPKSFMPKELIRLEITELMPDFTWKDLRKRGHMAHVRVLLSLHLGDNIVKKQKEILARLHIPIANSSADASHFIADKFTRTRNMLECIALGKPVVTHLWLETCGQVGGFVDEKNFILRDAIKEKELGFDMATSLARAAKHPLLEGRKVLITPNIKPEKEMITSLVKAVKGQVITRRQVPITEQGHVPDDVLILSCVEDQTACTPFVKKGAKIYSSELILSGIVAQKLEYQRHELFRANKESNVLSLHASKYGKRIFKSYD